jgi:dipeptidyl aminopeptidase/acylaminoacyl peptidase
MKNIVFWVLWVCLSNALLGQRPLDIEDLWSFGRVAPLGITQSGDGLVYKVITPDIKANTFVSKTYLVDILSGDTRAIDQYDTLLVNNKRSQDKNLSVFSQSVKLSNILGKDKYPALSESNVYIYDALDYRHWDTWNEGNYNHVFIAVNRNGKMDTLDIMENQPYHCPQKPFGGGDDYILSPNGDRVVYVSKKLKGTEYALSTNTDLYSYDIKTGNTINLTEGMEGYDTHPSFSSKGILAWLSMARNGYEADKQDLYVMLGDQKINLTQDFKETIFSFAWAPSAKSIYFTSPTRGTIQLFELLWESDNFQNIKIQPLTQGPFDINAIVGITDEFILVTRSDMNRANEVYKYYKNNKTLVPLTKVNDEKYSAVAQSKVEERWIKTKDGKDLFAWVVYPPNFDPNLKYPTLLYLQGGPQSPLSQFYSFRWNFQLMAAKGYLVVAPNRRGMPGHGLEWNESISQDWGGAAIQDYLDAIDDFKKEKYVDHNRIAAVGASFGGYSALYLAGVHEGRFKSFISHCGVFNLESMYGTTEEMFFVNWDFGGPYWEKDNPAIAKTYTHFNPKNLVSKWDTPILIIQGGKDYRVPIGQGQEAFQAAQLLGLKSKFLYFPEENHWILSPQNALIWQNEFFAWLKETL